MSDKAGDNIVKENANWSFGGGVSKNFDSHVSKSVPLYHEGHDLIMKLSDYFLHEDSICYDLGCSTGSLLKKISLHSPKKIQLVGIDEEKSMILEAKKKCKNVNNLDFFESKLIDNSIDMSVLSLGPAQSSGTFTIVGSEQTIKKIVKIVNEMPDLKMCK